MDRSDAILPVMLLVMFLWQNLVTPLFPLNLQFLGGFMGFGLVFGAVILNEQILKFQAASYNYMEAVCRPSNQKLHLFVNKKYEIKEIAPGKYACKFSLGQKVKHHFYQWLEYIVIQHNLEPEKRFKFDKGKAFWKGQWVDHPNTARITLYESFEGSADLYHSNPIPRFDLKEAPGDYFLPQIALQESMLATNGGGMLDFDIQEAARENESLKRENTALKREKLSAKQDLIRAEEALQEQKNETQGLLKTKTDHMIDVVEHFFTYRELQLTIERACRKLKKSAFGLTDALVLLLLGGGVLGAFVFDVGGFREWVSLSQNQFFLIVLVAVVVFAYYYAIRKRRKVKL